MSISHNQIHLCGATGAQVLQEVTPSVFVAPGAQTRNANTSLFPSRSTPSAEKHDGRIGLGSMPNRKMCARASRATSFVISTSVIWHIVSFGQYGTYRPSEHGQKLFLYGMIESIGEVRECNVP